LFLQKISQALINQKHYFVLLIYFALTVLISYELTDSKSLPIFFSVFYDSEPDFLSNSVTKFLLGYPVETYHPSDLMFFIGSEVINFFKPEDIETFISYSRKSIFFLGVILTIPLIIKHKLFQALIIIFLAFLSPEAMYLSSQVSPHWLSFFFMAYIIYFSRNVLENKKESIKDHLFLGIFSIFSLGIKHTFLIVVIPIYILVIYKSFYKTEKNTRLLFIYLLLALFAFMYLIRSIFIAPIHLFINTAIFSHNTWIENYLIIIIGSLLIIYFFYILYKYRRFIRDHAPNILLTYFKALAIVTILTMIFYYSNRIPYTNIFESRHAFFFLPFLTVLIGDFDSKKFSSILLILSFALIFIFQIGDMKKYSNFLFENRIESELIDNSFNKIVSKLEEKYGVGKDIAIFPTSAFVSEEYFPLWGGYRYGTRFESKLHNKIFLSDKNLHIFSITKFLRDRDIFKNKLIQRYLSVVSDFGDLIKPLKFASHLYEDNRGRDLCTQPFDGYQNKDFMVLQIKSNKKSTSNLWPDKYEYSINEFIEKFPKECNMETTNLHHGKEDNLEYRFFQVFKKPMNDWGGVDK